MAVIRLYGTPQFAPAVSSYLKSVPGLIAKYKAERDLTRIPVTLPDGKQLTIGGGGQNVLIKQMVDDFCAYFVPGGEVLYIGDADSKLMHFDVDKLGELGVVVNTHGKLPDLVVYQPDKNWLFLMEAASSHGRWTRSVTANSLRSSLALLLASSTCPVSPTVPRCGSS